MKQTNGDICANYVRTRSQAYVLDCELRCRNCDKPYDKTCKDYVSAESQHMTVSKGRGLVHIIKLLQEAEN